MLLTLLRSIGQYSAGEIVMMFVMMLLALTISFSFHEFMHAVVADFLGDNTPRLMGRITLNPLAHMDPMGTVLLLLVGFGWGKPVSYNPNNLKRFKSKRLMKIMVSLAGVTGNLIIALVAMIIISIIMKATGFPSSSPVIECMFYVAAGLNGGYGVPLYGAVSVFTLYYIFIFSMSLLAFNLLPIPPLDGFHVVEELLPLKVTYSEGFRKFLRYGPTVLLALIILGNIANINLLGAVMNVIKWPFEIFINFLSGLIGRLG